MTGIIEFVEKQEPFFTPKIVDNAVYWDKEKQFAIQAFQSNDYLAKIALSNPVAAQNAIINVAAIGITLNPAQKLAYLVPRNGSICLDISYMGLMHLAMETGSIRWGQAVIVYSNDVFKRIGIDKAPLHEVDEFGDRGEPVGAYCVVKTSDGDYLTETMKREAILKIRDRSQGYKSGKQSPWNTDELEMWRKTVVKRASKYWPKVERLNAAIEYINTTNDEGYEKEPVMPHYTEEQVNALKKESDNKFMDEVSAMCDEMTQCETFAELKQQFGAAFIKTKGHPVQKEVQVIYEEMKGKLNV